MWVVVGLLQRKTYANLLSKARAMKPFLSAGTELLVKLWRSNSEFSRATLFSTIEKPWFNLSEKIMNEGEKIQMF